MGCWHKASDYHGKIECDSYRMVIFLAHFRTGHSWENSNSFSLLKSLYGHPKDWDRVGMGKQEHK